jgi:leucyl aminopeptidase
MLTINNKKKFDNEIEFIQSKDKKNFNLSFMQSKQLTEKTIIGMDKNPDLISFKSSLESFVKSNKLNSTINVDHFLSLVSEDKKKNLLSILVDVLEQFSTDEAVLKSKKPEPVHYNLISKSKTTIKNLEVELEIAQEKTFVRKLQDLPSNIINPVTMLEQIKKQYGNIPGLKISSLSQKELIKKGMNLMVGVNLGSDIDCQLVVLEYNGNPKSKEKIAYVGKGVCFDSGGYSLKPSNYMTGMKYDMSGAAIVCTSVALAAKHKLKTNLVAVAGLVMNKISAKAQLVDDVITSYSGKTVEILNTDAEGRLVLGDCITYAIRDMKATKILDVATLTGAMAYSLGSSYTGVWTTEDDDWNKIHHASIEANELIWRMPFHPDWDKAVVSKIADLANAVLGGKAGSCTAASFLKAFTEKKPYIHLDIAGTADVSGKGTAVAVRTLLKFAEL